jgi:Fe2+ transport system protein B
MSIYNEQYKQYYEGLKSKAIGQGIKTVRTQEYPSFYSGYVRSNKKNTKNNLSEWIDISVSQLIVTLVLALIILYMKYSTNLQVVDAFKTFKSSINEKVSYAEMYEEVKSIDINSIINKAKDSILWIKEKVDENPLNY